MHLKSCQYLKWFKFIFTIFKMGLFRAAHEWWGGGGGGQKGPLPKIRHTYPTMLKP